MEQQRICYFCKENMKYGAFEDIGCKSIKINGIYFDNVKKELWLGVVEMGIDIVHLKNNSTTHLNINTYPIKSIVKNSVNEIIKDKQENIWIATNDGVLKYDPTRKQIKVINDQEPFDIKLPFTKAWGALIDDKKHLIYAKRNKNCY